MATYLLTSPPFNAVGNGIADDTAAIQAWAAMAGPNVELVAPAGTYKFTSSIVFPIVNRIVVTGSGKNATIFEYSGASTSIDLFTFGNGTTSLTGAAVSGLSIRSQTKMAGGAACRIRKMQNGSDFSDLGFGALNGNHNLWDGIWFDNCNVSRFRNFETDVTNSGFVCSGDAATDTGSDIYLDAGTVLNGNIGYHIAGGMGGVYFGAVLAFGCGTNYKIDNARANRFNREVIYSSLCVSDACKDNGIHINDPLAGGANCTIDAFIGSAGRASGSVQGGNCIYVQSYPNSRITIGSSQIFNAMGNGSSTGHGLSVNDATTLISLSSRTQITNNQGWGIYASAAAEKISAPCQFASNAAGDINANVREWTSTSLSVTSLSGSLGSANGFVRKKSIGTSLFVNVVVSITNNGTGAGAISATMPFTVRENTSFAGRASAISGKAIIGFMNANSNVMSIINYDNSYPGSTGEKLNLSGTCEIYR